MSMEQIHRIKELQLQQKGPYQIANELGIDPKTVRKYMQQEDFSPPPPTTEIRASKLDPYKATIDNWLREDEQNRHKQRHTAQRVFNRLKQKYPDFSCSYPTVVRYVRSFRQAQQLSRNGYLELQWHPGEAQADFGECDILLNGVRRVCRYLVLSFPHSNAAFVQCFLGETAECLCQGLMDIFQHIGGVPRRLIMDNATGAGRRIGEVVRLTQFFKRFQAHFGFEITFCNPASGHEKGNVENKVGYVRRNYFVPLPRLPLSTAIRALLRKLDGSRHRLLYLSDANPNPRSFYRALLEQLGMKPAFQRADGKRQLDTALMELWETQRTVVVIDEAHLLSPAMLEEVRFLTNHQMDSTSPLSLLLVGQPELGRKLTLQAFEAVRQRITLRPLLARIISRVNYRMYEITNIILHNVKAFITMQMSPAGNTCEARELGDRRYLRNALTLSSSTWYGSAPGFRFRLSTNLDSPIS